MVIKTSRQRLYAGLLAIGAGILLYRTIAMLAEGILKTHMPWVSALLFAELLLDLGCLIGSIRWCVANDRDKARLPLRFGAAAAILHAIRVLVFVIGRAGPWVDFDIRPEYRNTQEIHWTWTGVYLAAVLSVLGIIGVIILWILIRKARKKRFAESRN